MNKVGRTIQQDQEGLNERIKGEKKGITNAHVLTICNYIQVLGNSWRMQCLQVPIWLRRARFDVYQCKICLDISWSCRIAFISMDANPFGKNQGRSGGVIRDRTPRFQRNLICYSQSFRTSASSALQLRLAYYHNLRMPSVLDFSSSCLR